MRPLSERKTISVCWDDIQSLNERTLRLLADPDLGCEACRLLQVSRPVVHAISSANSRSLGIASRCTVPLVTFSSTLEGAVTREPRQSTIESSSQIHVVLQELTLFTLRFAQALVLRNVSLAHAFFGFSHLFAERFSGMALLHLESVSRYRGCLLQLRGNQDVAAWEALLAGDLIGDERGQLLARVSAYQMLIAP